MSLRSYRAKSLSEALRMVRREMGPDAEVVESREVHAGILGRITGSGRRYEVLARDGRLDSTAETGLTAVEVVSGFAEDAIVSGERRAFAPRESRDELGDAVPDSVARADQVDYRSHLRQGLASEGDSLLADLVQQQLNTTAETAQQQLRQIVVGLMAADVDARTAREIVAEIQESSAARDLLDPRYRWRKFTQVMRRRARVYGPIQLTDGQVRRVAFVGPTGAGKTSTIAKLAASFRLYHGLKVGMVSCDTYRVAAVEQLRAYADTLDVPCEIVTTGREMRAAMNRLSHLEIVLIDTAGRNPRDEMQMEELRAMLCESRADEVHLVMSVQASSRQLEATAQQFASIHPTSMIWTKLDEVVHAWHLLSLLWRSDLPLSYTTHGQRVPDDIQVVHVPRLLDWIGPEGLSPNLSSSQDDFRREGATSHSVNSNVSEASKSFCVSDNRSSIECRETHRHATASDAERLAEMDGGMQSNLPSSAIEPGGLTGAGNLPIPHEHSGKLHVS